MSSIITLRDSKVYSTVDFKGFDDGYVFSYDNNFKKMMVKLFNDYIPKVREFVGFGGKTYRNNIFPEFFTISAEKADNYTTIIIANKNGSPLYYFNFNNYSDYIDIFKVNNVWIEIYDQTTLVDSVHKRVLI